jgi:hypothetical protein
VTDRIDSVVYVRADEDDACLGSVLGAGAVLVASHRLLDDVSSTTSPRRRGEAARPSRVLVVDRANARFSVRSVEVLDPNGTGATVSTRTLPHLAWLRSVTREGRLD